MDNPVAKIVEELNNAEPVPIPEHMVSVEAMLDHSLNFAKSQLIGSDDDEDESTLIPTWTLLTQNGLSVIMATPFNSGPEGKDMVALAVKLIMREAHVIRYTFMSEAWVATTSKDNPNFDTPPSERPDRKEVLMISGGDRKNGEKVRVYDIVRDEDGSVVDLKFDKEMDAVPGYEGRFSGLLEVARH